MLTDLPFAPVWSPPYVQWVVKASKFCNLRCRYCYEFPSLAERARITPEQLRQMFAHVARHYEGSGKHMDFVWHGGEPLLLGQGFFDTIDALQRTVFVPIGLEYSNSIQTNLTLLNRNTIDLLRRFRTIGVSLDLFGDQRVDTRGRPAEPRTIENMQRLQDAGVRFGCITVLSRHTLDHVEEIYRFFEDLEISVRFLPIYRTGYPGQNAPHAVSSAEIVSAYKKLVDLWFASPRHIGVRPVTDYVEIAVRQLSRGAVNTKVYDKSLDEVIYIVDTDGTLFSNSDAYDRRLAHGNIFTQTLSDIRRSSGCELAISSARRRMRDACARCHYLGSCSGFFAAEATPEQREYGRDGRLRCAVVRPMLEYISQKLHDVGAIDADHGLITESQLHAQIARLRSLQPSSSVET